mgnify:CR=1 FL=1
MSDTREASLPEYINMLGNSYHRAAKEYVVMVQRIAELEKEINKKADYNMKAFEHIAEQDKLIAELRDKLNVESEDA